MTERVRELNIRVIALWAVLALFTMVSTILLVQMIWDQPPGFDFSLLWTGARVAMRRPDKLYDFAYVLTEHARLTGDNHTGPFVYPPSALWALAPFAWLSLPWAYGLWLLGAGGLFMTTAMRVGARWWLVLFPPIMLTAVPGQTPFLLGGLTIAALSLGRREVAAGIVFGLAAAFKPQLLVLLPVALLAEARWRTIFATGLTGAALVVGSIILWGPRMWIAWLGALARFQEIFFTTASASRAITPYAWLNNAGIDGRWAFVLAPLAILGVWITFRRTKGIAERTLALLGGALLITPYAMNYEVALLVPATAVFLARTSDRRWPASLAAACLLGLGFVFGAPALIAGLALLAWVAWDNTAGEAIAAGAAAG